MLKVNLRRGEGPFHFPLVNTALKMSDGGTDDVKALIVAAKEKVSSLSSSIRVKAIASKSALRSDGHVHPFGGKLRSKRKLAGHFGKVVSIAWDRSGERAMTASQDGNVIVWNGMTAKKQSLIQLKSSWVMFSEMSQCGREIFATGGLDNVATIWNMPTGEACKPEREFFGHEGYVCGAKFLEEEKLVTTSGDGTAALWNLSRSSENSKRSHDKVIDDRHTVYEGHEKDVSSVDVRPEARGEFATSSTDGTCMLWNVDKNTPNAILRVDAGSSQLVDVNKCRFSPNGYGLGMATEALGSLLFDIRTRKQINSFDSTTPDLANSAKYSIAFSKSGRLAFVACEDCSIEIWDTLLPDQKKPYHQLNNAHVARITDVALPHTGFCVGAVSWDTFGTITAP